MEGSVEDLTDAAKDTMEANLRSSTRCFEPECQIIVVYSSGSIQVDTTIEMAVGDVGGGGGSLGPSPFDDMLSTVQSLTSDADSLSAATGVPITTVSQPVAQEGVEVLRATFPPPSPPSPPTSPSPPPSAVDPPAAAPSPHSKTAGIVISSIFGGVVICGGMLMLSLMLWRQRAAPVAPLAIVPSKSRTPEPGVDEEKVAPASPSGEEQEAAPTAPSGVEQEATPVETLSKEDEVSTPAPQMETSE